MEASQEWLAWAFTFANSIRSLFYIPQILVVARSVDGARDIALSTWCMWVLNNLIGALYGAFIAHDVALAMSFVVSALGCAVVIVLSVWKRRGLAHSVALAH